MLYGEAHEVIDREALIHAIEDYHMEMGDGEKEFQSQYRDTPFSSYSTEDLMFHAENRGIIQQEELFE